MTSDIATDSPNGKNPIDDDDDNRTTGITNPRDTDVLCGRGGAALRHPGNQTYRRLVNLNKGLYITCLKTEKLKISRSIVAAIREQKGRFLEKDSGTDSDGKGTWYDIGDKKAIEVSFVPSLKDSSVTESPWLFLGDIATIRHVVNTTNCPFLLFSRNQKTSQVSEFVV
jgi:hypothetical protein